MRVPDHEYLRFRDSGCFRVRSGGALLGDMY